MMTPGAGPFTTIHVILLAIFVLLTIAMIARGVVLKRRRAEAQRVQDEVVDADEEPSTVAAAQAPTLAPAIDMPPTSSNAPVADVVAPTPPVPIGQVPSRQTQSQQTQSRQTATPATAPSPLEESPTHPTLADEPIAAAAPFDTSPVPVDASPPAATLSNAPGDWPVTTLKGLGPKVAILLGELGIATVADMAALDTHAAQAIDAQLGAFTGRMGRDRWLDQARLLVAGDVTGFEAAFGKL